MVKQIFKQTILHHQVSVLWYAFECFTMTSLSPLFYSKIQRTKESCICQSATTSDNEFVICLGCSFSSLRLRNERIDSCLPDDNCKCTALGPGCQMRCPGVYDPLHSRYIRKIGKNTPTMISRWIPLLPRLLVHWLLCEHWRKKEERSIDAEKTFLQETLH